MALIKHSLSPVASFAPSIGFSLAALEEVREQLREDGRFDLESLTKQKRI